MILTETHLPEILLQRRYQYMRLAKTFGQALSAVIAISLAAVLLGVDFSLVLETLRDSIDGQGVAATCLAVLALNASVNIALVLSNSDGLPLESRLRRWVWRRQMDTIMRWGSMAAVLVTAIFITTTSPDEDFASKLTCVVVSVLIVLVYSGAMSTCRLRRISLAR